MDEPAASRLSHAGAMGRRDAVRHLAFAVRTRLTAKETRAWSEVARTAAPAWEADPEIRAARVPGADGNTYLVVRETL